MEARTSHVPEPPHVRPLPAPHTLRQYHACSTVPGIAQSRLCVCDHVHEPSRLNATNHNGMQRTNTLFKACQCSAAAMHGRHASIKGKLGTKCRRKVLKGV
eukprot:2029446-Rhodomonas_salina.1